MLDQDYKTMRQMQVLRNVYDTVQMMPRVKGADIHNLPPSVARTAQYLRDEGLM